MKNIETKLGEETREGIIFRNKQTSFEKDCIMIISCI